MMEDRKKKILVGTVIIILVVGIITIIALWKSSPRCELTDKRPVEGDPSSLKNIPDTKDYKSLATFDGYLIYRKESTEASYLPLGFESLDNIKDGALTMSTDCAKLELYLITSKEGVKVGNIRIDLTVPSTYSNKSDFFCIVSGPNMFAPTGKHYRSSAPDIYECITNSDAKLYLWVNAMEFEVNGDPKDIKEGKYSTPAAT